MNDYNTIERIAQALVDLTERLAKQGYETSAGLLGGEFGYGAFYEDDTFHMRPYCWCGKDDCMWCAGCLCARPGDDDCEYCKPGERMLAAGGLAGTGAPNFWHKPSGLRVWWYKYIGRGMRFDVPDGIEAVALIDSLAR